MKESSNSEEGSLAEKMRNFAPVGHRKDLCKSACESVANRGKNLIIPAQGASRDIADGNMLKHRIKFLNNSFQTDFGTVVYKTEFTSAAVPTLLRRLAAAWGTC